ncbi:MAG: MATE family efflux transporter [Xanthomonadales bacterium]|nr:MATE family efflux transporter [Xanthomonadales bacterium]
MPLKLAHSPRWYFPDTDRRRPILEIALPIMGGMASQNVLNLVDAAMVGRLGDVALAAAGMGSFANFMAMSIILGLATGVQAMASRRVGEGKHDETAVPLNGGLFLALLIGLPLSLILIGYADSIFRLLNDDPAVVEEGGAYLGMRLAAIVGVGMNFAFRGYWSAVKMTRFYMRTLLIMHSLNIFLNWVLIFGNLGAPAMGVVGAGLATTLSIYVGTAIYLALAFTHSRDAGFLHRLPGRAGLATILRVSFPSSLQQFFFSSGMVALFWIVGQIGTSELAAIHVLMTLALVAILPALGLGIAGASLVGHALGARDPEDAERWGWNVATLAGVTGVAIGLPALLFHDPILGFFLTEPDTARMATLPLLITASFIWYDAAGMTLFNAHLGAGDTRRVMVITIVCQWGVFLPLAYLVGPVLGFGLLTVWILNIGYRMLQATLFARSWRAGEWSRVEV